jgi:hypothetical protein
VTYSLTGAFFLAPKYFVPVDDQNEPRKHGGPAAFNWRTLDEGSILPAFTSLELFLDFVQTYYAGEGSTVPAHLNLKAFELADVLEFLEPEGVEAVAIDPVSNRAGQWSDPWETMSAEYFRRLAEEMRPGLNRLFAEVVAELGYSEDWDAPQSLRKVKRLSAPRVDDVVKDAHARIQEWETNEGS